MPPQLFRPGANAIFRGFLLLAGLLILAAACVALAFYQSPWWSHQGMAPSQPVLFSHRHHAGELGIDCRYCHASVETSAFAGFPPTQTCLSCHSQIFTDTAMLEPVIRSGETGEPLQWNRVTRIPDFVYFNHSIHIAKGIGCTTCHGAVGDMALMAKGERLDMRQCVDCHRDPIPHLRSHDQVFFASWSPPADQIERGTQLLTANGISVKHLSNCSTCHR